MPPPRRFARKKHEHHVIWAGRDGRVQRVCAHCPMVFGEYDLRATYTDEELRRAVRGSQAGHAHLCTLPVV